MVREVLVAIVFCLGCFVAASHVEKRKQEFNPTSRLVDGFVAAMTRVHLIAVSRVM